MKRLKFILTISIAIPYFGISQNSKSLPDSVTCIPNSQLKQAVVLIEEGKLAKQEVVYLKDKVSLIEKQIAIKDTIISTLRGKDFNWQVYEQKTEQTIANMKTQIKNLEESYKMQKKTTNKIKTHRLLLSILSAFTITYAILNLQ